MVKETELKHEIKKAYTDMAEIIKINQPEIYLMPIPLFNRIMKRIGFLESKINDLIKSRNMWRERYEKLKNS